MKIIKKIQSAIIPRLSTRPVCRGMSAALFLALNLVAVAQDVEFPAAPQVVEYSTGISAGAVPAYITAGPDGNLWFAEVGLNRIARITTDGVVTEFSAGITPNSGPSGITAGRDGNLWFTEGNSVGRIGRITPDGVVTEFDAGLDSHATPFGITHGPDGNLWFTILEFTLSHTTGKIGRITLDGVITEFGGISRDSMPLLITTGPNQELWFSEETVSGIANITLSGVVTEFKTGFNPSIHTWGVTRASDGNVWFTEAFNPGGLPAAAVGKITTAGVVTEYRLPDPSADPRGIVYYRGALWFTEYGATKIGNMGLDGTLRGEVGGISCCPYAICIGPDGNLWFTELFGDRVGKVIVRQ